MYTRPVSIPFLGTVRLAVLGFFLFAFSAWAQKSPAPQTGDPVPTTGDPLPKVADPIPTIGDPIPTIGDPIPSPAPQTGDFKFAEGEDPIIFPAPDDKGQDLDPGKNDPLTPPVPGKDDPSVDSPGVAVDPRPESGEGS